MPFGGYKDFAACVAANSKQKDPKAYCAVIQHKVEGEHKKESILTQFEAKSVIDVSEAEFAQDETTGKMTANLVLIRAGRAKNPRTYRPSALQRAAKEGIYNGLRMFVNHSDKPPVKRDFGEMVSAVESTTWDPTVKPHGAIRAVTEIFDKDFFEKAQRAKGYMGVSADHKIDVTYIKEGQKTIQDVHRIMDARSVDWVIFPSAGGEIVDFVREAEGAEQVEWDSVSLDDLKANAPAVLQAYRDEIVKNAEDADPGIKAKESEEEDEDAAKPMTLTRSELAQLVKEQVEEVQTAASANAVKVDAAQKKVKEFVSKSGLKPLAQARIVGQFSGKTEYVEEAVKEAVENAKAELKEAGAGPRISGMGPSGDADAAPVGSRNVSVRESVEGVFGKKPATDEDDKKK